MLMPFVCHPNILHKYCFQFLLGPFWLPRETEDIAKGKILGLQTKSIMVFYVIFWSSQSDDFNLQIKTGVLVCRNMQDSVLTKQLTL